MSQCTKSLTLFPCSCNGSLAIAVTTNKHCNWCMHVTSRSTQCIYNSINSYAVRLALWHILACTSSTWEWIYLRLHILCSTYLPGIYGYSYKLNMKELFYWCVYIAYSLLFNYCWHCFLIAVVIVITSSTHVWKYIQKTPVCVQRVTYFMHNVLFSYVYWQSPSILYTVHTFMYECITLTQNYLHMQYSQWVCTTTFSLQTCTDNVTIIARNTNIIALFPGTVPSYWMHY